MLGLQTNYKQLADAHLAQRFADNPEFKKNFLKTFSDLIFSQDEEMLEKLSKTRQNTLLNSIFKGNRSRGKFCEKRGIIYSLCPHTRKQRKKALKRRSQLANMKEWIIFDINFQKENSKF